MDTPEGSVVLFQFANTHRTLIPPDQVYVCNHSVYCIQYIYFVIYGIISDFTDKGQFQYLTNLKGSQEGTYLYTTQFLSLR